jgi:hypothetical protein
MTTILVCMVRLPVSSHDPVREKRSTMKRWFLLLVMVTSPLALASTTLIINQGQCIIWKDSGHPYAPYPLETCGSVVVDSSGNAVEQISLIFNRNGTYTLWQYDAGGQNGVPTPFTFSSFTNGTFNGGKLDLLFTSATYVNRYGSHTYHYMSGTMVKN